MASVQRNELIATVEKAILASGYAGACVPGIHEDPLRMLLSGPSLEAIPVWVYIRNLTPAVRRDPDEYRIQLRSQVLPLSRNPAGPTVLLGYHAESRLFVGFDPSTISTGARTQLSSGYVSLRSVKRSVRRGMTFDRDRRDRIAVGFRPDMFVPYCLHASEIHAAADEQDIIPILSSAAATFMETSGDTPDERFDEFAPARQRLLKEVSVLSRKAGFRNRVLRTYGWRCAVSGVQLGLVEAAHILPVRVPGSPDTVNNGLSLLPQYHRAYDSGLIYMDINFVMHINEHRALQLEERGWGRGLAELRCTLGRIRLPSDRRRWPSPQLIESANEVRGIAYESH